MAQMQAVTGRKVKPNYLAAIEAQSAYLPSLYRQKAEDELANRSLALSEKSLAQETEQAARNEALAREELEETKKQAKRGNLISAGNLGLKTGLGLYSQFGDSAKEAVKGATPSLIGASSIPADITSGSFGLTEAPSAVGEAAGGLADWATDLGKEAAGGLIQGASDAGSAIWDIGSDIYGATLGKIFSWFG